jgi:hypothetical protein
VTVYEIVEHRKASAGSGFAISGLEM